MNNTQKISHLGFDRIAKTYLQNAMIQNEAAQEIADYLLKAYISKFPHPILDLGSGPGTFMHIAELATQPVILYDSSYSMLNAGLTNNNLTQAVHGVAEQLPFKDNSIKLIISNLMLQWSHNKHIVIQEISRILAPHGIFIFTTLIPPSLLNLQTVLKNIDGTALILKFIDTEIYKSYCKDAGLKVLYSHTWSTTLLFNTCLDLLQHFKNTGTNIIQVQKPGLHGVKLLKQLQYEYNKHHLIKNTSLKQNNPNYRNSHTQSLLISQKYFLEYHYLMLVLKKNSSLLHYQ